MPKKTVVWTGQLLLLVLGLAVAVLISLNIGPSGFTTDRSILFDLRLPRILLGFAVGGSLSLAGVLLQGLFRNPLVEPYTLGISGGAAVGVAVGIMLGFARRTVWSLPFSGFIGAGLVVFLLYFLSFRRRELKIQSLLLSGVMLSFICSSLMMLLMALSRTEDLHGIVYWTMGSLDEANRLLVYGAVVFSLLGLLAAYLLVFELNAFSLGEEEALHLGIRTERSKRLIFALASLLTGLAVSAAGIIGFVGLLVPHFTRLFFGSDHRIVLGGAFLSGAIFLILCDTLARVVIAPLELPVGVITGIAGGSFFVYLLLRKS